MKFDVWKDIVSQSSYFKARPDPLTLRGVKVGNLKSLENARLEWRDWNETWWEK